MNGSGAAKGMVRLRENCFVRDAPSASGAVLGVAKRGDALPWGGTESSGGWLAVTYRGDEGWVSGRLADWEWAGA